MDGVLYVFVNASGRRVTSDKMQVHLKQVKYFCCGCLEKGTKLVLPSVKTEHRMKEKGKIRKRKNNSEFLLSFSK